jgi:hypothetical protein
LKKALASGAFYDLDACPAYRMGQVVDFWQVVKIEPMQDTRARDRF